MTIVLQILLGVVAFICLFGGLNLLFKGAHGFLPPDIPHQRVLDNHFRFTSGIYFSMGFMMIWVIAHIDTVRDLNYFIGIVAAFAGLGRFFSRLNVGSAGIYFDTIMVLEILLGVVIIILQFLRSV